MHTIKDFAQLFKCSTRTIHRYLCEIKPILNGFDLTKRKRVYTDEEAAAVMDLIKTKHPQLIKRQTETLSDILKKSLIEQ